MFCSQVVETSRGSALAEEYSIKFYETSAKSNINVVEAFTSIAQDIKKRLMDNPVNNTNQRRVIVDNQKPSKSCACK